ncbi:hypothetical protein LNAOJCKE_5633 [Methylorubrum aminovorans]|uniref:RiboL-PSP-HEPN domain-containing protein n=1 Tax=Methylorubrum aminovorans TaxID=269069 RepID=A0ABQ4UM85_9HYPH|nr:hypothetical protein [Methylorubrum aminovorans]GJE68395.1 hypothetical protein LNAOJCKE_5633 [Methylorubrum aminovorans]GMA79905.1 hypothetical protein GCM10025880_63220 [Methylorubrum aminovorans]
MKLVAEILATFNEIDSHLTSIYNAAINANDSAAQQAIADKRVLTENAFFVLLWGQLENEINDRVGKMIAAGNSESKFETRRLFYNLDLDRMKFEDRLALVADKHAGPGSAWKKAITYYSLRNNIAHGNSDRSGVSFLTVVPDFYDIQSKLIS